MPEYSVYKKDNALHNIIIVNYFLRKIERLSTPPRLCRSRSQASQRLTSEDARLSVVHELEFRPAYEVKTGTFDPQTTFGRPGIPRSPLTSEQKFCKIEVKKNKKGCLKLFPI